MLLERAGLAVFHAVRELLPDGGKIAVLCGKGNNGGDGLVVARLAQEAGYGVECLIAAAEEAGIGPVLWGSVPEMGHAVRIEGTPPRFAQEGQSVYRWATTRLPSLARQVCAKAGHTRSPTPTRVTPAPVATTRPAPSDTGTSGNSPVRRP